MLSACSDGLGGLRRIIYRKKITPPGVTITVALGGVVHCFDFQVAVLERYFEGFGVAFKVLDRKKVEEKFEASPVLMYHFKK